MLIICAALLFLSATLVDLNSIDLKIAANQRDSLQAYYLAETGMEVALALLKHGDSFYVGHKSFPFGGGIVSLKVEAEAKENGSRHVNISSTGTVGTAVESLNLHFQSIPSRPAGTDGTFLGWYDPSDGRITPGEHISGIETVLLGSAPLALPLSLYRLEEGNGRAIFAAKQLYFLGLPTSLYLEEYLELQAEVVVFYGRIILSPSAGMLHLSHPAASPLRVYLQEGAVDVSSRLLLGPGVYDFPHGFQFTADIFPQEAYLYRVLPVVPGTMIRREGR